METTGPTLVYQSAVGNYGSAGALAVLIWDILDNIPADYRILFRGRDLRRKKKKFTLKTLSLLFFRIGALGYQLVGVVFSTAPVRHCALLNDIAFGWCPLSFGATGLLFFLRLRAVYNDNRLVVRVFFILWLGLLVSGILLPIGFKGGPMGDTPYCTHVSMSTVAFYAQLAPIVFDTLVFFAISWRLSRIGTLDKASPDAGTNTLDKTVLGDTLPKFNFARSLLIDGQIYYLLTIVPGIVSAVLTLSSLLPDPLSDLFQDSYLILVNIMACRVFRRTRSGDIREFGNSTTVHDQSTCEPIRFSPKHDSSNDITSIDNFSV